MIHYRCANPAPGIARRLTYFSSNSCKVPLRTHAKDGRVEPVLGGGVYLKSDLLG